MTSTSSARRLVALAPCVALIASWAGTARSQSGWEHGVCTQERVLRTTDDARHRREVARQVVASKEQGFRQKRVEAAGPDPVSTFLTSARACWFTCDQDTRAACEANKAGALSDATTRANAAMAAGDHRLAVSLLRVAAGITPSSENQAALGRAMLHANRSDGPVRMDVALSDRDLAEASQLAYLDPPRPIRCEEHLSTQEIEVLVSEPIVATEREADERRAACFASFPGGMAAVQPSGPPPPPRTGQEQAWRRTFHESFSYLTFASVHVSPEGVTTGRAEDAWVLFVGGAKTWRPRDWVVYPWMEAGIDLGTSAYRSDPPEGGEQLLFAGVGGSLGADVRVVPWDGHKLNLAAGPLIGGHAHAIPEGYGWDLGGRMRGLWEKKAGEAPLLMGELRVYRRTDVASEATYAQVVAGVGLGSVVLHGLYSGRMAASDCPQDANWGECSLLSSTWGIGLRTYSDRE